MGVKTIDEVLAELDKIVQETINEGNYLGIFAFVYRRTTEQIKYEIEKGNFENNELLEQLDVLFAQYYLDAYNHYRQGNPVSKSWQTVFESKNERLTIIQHLLLGMNAHINLDLALAASKLMKDKPIEALENDFHKVNDILAGLLNEMQSRISRISFLMFLLDLIGKRTDEKLINFSMKQARTQAWRVARELWSFKGTEKENRIIEVDRSIHQLGEFIKNPKSGFLKFILKIIGWFEVKNIKKIIGELRKQQLPFEKNAEADKR